MRYIFISLGALLVLLLGAIFIGPTLIPDETYRTRVQDQLRQELDRDVELQGEIFISTFPALKARVDGVRIANPDGFSSRDFMTLERLDARIKLLPLLTRRVEISRFILLRPVISLERRADGLTNWEFGDEEETPTPTDDGPFKRDGRYTNLDPNISAFQIVDGRLTYIDATTDTAFPARDINTFLSLPSLGQTLEIEGNLISDDQPIELDLKIDNPRDILNGRAGTIEGFIEVGDIRLTADGRVPAGDELGFEGAFEIAADDLSILEPYLEDPAPFQALSQINANGQVNAVGTSVAISDTTLTAQGPAGSFQFNGDAAFEAEQSPSADGSLQFGISDPVALTPLLPEPVLGLSELSEIRGSATLRTRDGQSGIEAQNVELSINGPSLEGTFEGRGTYSDAIAVTGTFALEARNLVQLTNAFDLEAPEGISLTESVNANGNVSYSPSRTSVSNLVATVSGNGLDAQYQGSASLAETVTLDGALTAAVEDVSTLNNRLSEPVPYADAIGRADFSATINGPSDRLTLSNVDATLGDGDLNGNFRGSLTLSEITELRGNLALSGPSLRALLEQTSSPSALPPSTSDGEIFENFSVAGQVSGNLENMAFSNAEVSLDALTGTGAFGFRLKDERPYLTGELAMTGLDLRPYMAAYSAQAPEGGIQEWSDEPIEVEGLRAFDGQFTLSTPSVKLTRLSLGQTTVNATLTAGELTAKIPSLSLYGGRGTATANFDASGTVPTVSLTATLNQLDSQGFLADLAGFTKADGQAGTEISLRGQGRSQAAIMNTLTGQGDFQLLNGTISGIDVTEFLTGLEQALSTRSLPGGIGRSEITQFRDLLGRFSMSDGVASISQFEMQGPGFAAEGQGQIDVGAQTIDFRFRPKRTGENATGLGAFGIPLRISGPFNQARPSLDQEFLGEVIQAKARQEAQRLLEREVGGSVGGVLGELIGGGQRTTGSQTDGVGSEADSQTPRQSRGILDSLIKPNDEPSLPAEARQTGLEAETGAETDAETETGPDSESEADTTEPSEEEVVTGLLKGLFGQNRSDDDNN